MMVEIDGKLINTDKIHFVRRELNNSLLVSFGTDFLRFKGHKEYIDDIYNKLHKESNEKLSSDN